MQKPPGRANTIVCLNPFNHFLGVVSFITFIITTRIQSKGSTQTANGIVNFSQWSIFIPIKRAKPKATIICVLRLKYFHNNVLLFFLFINGNRQPC